MSENANVRVSAALLSQTERVITPAMIDAGVKEAAQHPLGGRLDELARKVYTAMHLALLTYTLTPGRDQSTGRDTDTLG